MNHIEKEFDLESVARMLGSAVNNFSGKTLLWTGTSGFLGQWIIRFFAHINEKTLIKPCRLLAYDISLPDPSDRAYFERYGVSFRSHDLSTKLWPVTEPIDYVVHMAGIASPFHYKKNPLRTIDVAIEGTRSTLEIAKHHGARYLFTSSSEVYQTASIVPTPETYIGAIASNNDRSCYDVSKLMGENLTHVYHKQFGLDACYIRIFNSFGPGIREGDARILPRIASSLVGGFPLEVFKSTPLPTRTYCPAANTVAGILLALLHGTPGQAYNIGVDGPEINVVELLSIIETVCKVKLQYSLVEPTAVYRDEPQRRCPDISKARQAIHYEPIVTLEEGLRSYFSWAKDRYTGIYA